MTTATSDPTTPPTLRPAEQRFILHWGEMGARWGVNRTIAQIHALLFLSPEPMTAEQISETLSVARSNVSTSLRELQGWGVVKITHQLGDRRDHFVTDTDVWEMFQTILDERKKREMDPTLEVLRECLQEAQRDNPDGVSTKRLRDMSQMIESLCDWYEQVRRMPTGAVVKFVKMGSKLRKLMGVA